MLRGLLLALLLIPSISFGQGFGGFVSPGDLAHDHADLDKITKCTSCHEPGAGVTQERCLACHESVEEQIANNKGFHAHLTQTCQSCHADHKGRDFELIQLDEETFNHQATGFALRGAHKPLECIECHEAAPDFSGLESDCASCHEEPHGAAESTRDLLTNCRTCHDAEDWEVPQLIKSIFDHDKPADADFPLHGQHADVACEDCHDAARFVPIGHEDCTDCHDDPHGTQFAGRDCEDCHTTEHKKFRTPNFDHSIWELVGAHGDLSCTSCHGRGKSAVYTPIDHARCDACHDDVHEGQFAPRDCDACHSSDPGGFTEGVIDHDQTDFPLRNAHRDVSCDDCHGEGPAATFVGLEFQSCESCHDDVHEARFTPDTCESCHTDGLWEVDEFDHSRTDFALDGAHLDAGCVDCHGEGEERQITGLAFASCLDCHAEDDPHNGELGPETCTDCHTTADWTTVAFDHAIWPLEGNHADVVCSDCHESPGYQGAQTECSSCHDRPEDHYEGECSTCHDPSGWTDATFGDLGHDATGFALEGAHGALACAECHAGSEPKAAAGPECIDCHGADDPHRNLLGQECTDCHRQDDWLRTTFRHAVTGYQLRGAHAVTACADCHAPTFAGTPDQCIRCHGAERPNDTLHNDPLTSDCELCHREHDWDDANFAFGGAR